MNEVYKTDGGIALFTSAGSQQRLARFPHDFVVKYKLPLRSSRYRSPKHIHMIVDLYSKQVGDKVLTQQLIDFVVNQICLKVSPVTSIPTAPILFHQEHATQFVSLNQYGFFPVDFLLICIELIQTQEITNYPTGTGHVKLYEMFQRGKDMPSVVTSATWNNRR